MVGGSNSGRVVVILEVASLELQSTVNYFTR